MPSTATSPGSNKTPVTAYRLAEDLADSIEVPIVVGAEEGTEIRSRNTSHISQKSSIIHKLRGTR